MVCSFMPYGITIPVTALFTQTCTIQALTDSTDKSVHITNIQPLAWGGLSEMCYEWNTHTRF